MNKLKDFKPGRLRVPIANYKTPEYKKDRTITFGIFTSILEGLITAHGRSMGVFLQNEKLKLESINIEDDYSEIVGAIYKQENN